YCSPVSSNQGQGGALPNYNFQERLLMAGGGGGGFGDNNYVNTEGGNGGGMVLIRSNEILGNAHSILANGESVTITSNYEGAGGGGAGGTIILACSNFGTTPALNLSATGGKGGDNNNAGTLNTAHGPGGGGGGGLIGLGTSAAVAGVNSNF